MHITFTLINHKKSVQNAINKKHAPLRCTLYIEHCALYDLHCTLYTVSSKLYAVRSTLYAVHCTL